MSATTATATTPAGRPGPDPGGTTDEMNETTSATARDGVIRRTYRAIGFSKAYNAAFFVFFGGAFLGFTLSRAMFLNVHGVFCKGGAVSPTRHAAPGECFYYEAPSSHEAVGIILHLGAVIPSALLVCLQFVPALRRRSPLFHRACGHVVLLLSLASSAGVLMIARHAFGGGLASQAGIGLLTFAFLGALGMAYANIRRLQIEEHRAWMLRAWFYAGAIITMRILMFVSASIVSRIGGYYMAEPCDKLDSLLGGRDRTLAAYPGCEPFFSGANPGQHALVYATMAGRAENIGAALDLNFGAALWLSLVLHAVGVEVYLRLTPAESERLRNVSYQRQLEAGLHSPGRAGLTVDRFGDAERWRPRSERREHHSRTRSRSRRRDGRNTSAATSEARRRETNDEDDGEQPPVREAKS